MVTIHSFHRRPVKPTLSAWGLALIMLLVLALGWHYPLVGYVVPLVMLAGIAGGFWRGRYVCGNLCPRGSFWDSWFLPLGGKRPIPKAIRLMKLRWGVFAGMMAMMVWQGAQNPTSVAHWGHVFWLMCAVTTAVGIGLGLVFDSRAWCALCPIGTLGHAASDGGNKRPLYLASDCRHCNLCEHACPMQLQLMKAEQDGTITQADCVQCSVCVRICPTKQLGWEKAA